VLVPVAVATAVGGVIGWMVATVSCRPGSCAFTAWFIAIAAALVTGFGMGVVVVLAIRSLDEWREASRSGREPPGPGCEGQEQE
jgi:Ni/Fe-hydrogenase subunit HybB-like protein